MYASGIGLYACQELYKVIVPKHGIRADCYTEFTIPLWLVSPCFSRFCCCLKKWWIFYSLPRTASRGEPSWRFPNFRRYCRPFTTTRAEFQKLRWLGFPLPLHCFALLNHDQVTPFIMFIAAFGRFMRRSRIPKCVPWHIYSR